jgi:CRP/FNR family cyclic AMP-dependent transcriptional regulator
VCRESVDLVPSARQPACKAAGMETLLAYADGLARRHLTAGERLVSEGMPPGHLYVLLDGALRVEKAGIPVAVIADPGACVGEVSLLLGTHATADVVAVEAAVVAVVEDAGNAVASDPELTLALARLLAARLQHMTTYLADLQRQYVDHEGGLGMVDVVLASLMHAPRERTELASERDPDPEY